MEASHEHKENDDDEFYSKTAVRDEIEMRRVTSRENTRPYIQVGLEYAKWISLIRNHKNIKGRRKQIA
jgi:hypothetical protein